MKHLIKNTFFVFLSAALFFSRLDAQTTLFTESFNSPSVTTFTLNTSDIGSVAGTADNKWVINNIYQGSAFSGDTPNQPAGIGGSPNSGYLHISGPPLLLGIIPNPQNANFLAPADGNKLAKMGGGVSTIGATNVKISFWVLCVGDDIATDAYYGRTYYSIDGGTNWIKNPEEYVQINNWKQVTVTNPAFDNQADLRFAFMWVQNSANAVSAKDPSFSVDDLKIEGTTGAANSITTSFSPQASYCPGASITVPFASTGSFTSGNIYKVQLSDASGSFANPVEIGTFSSTANSGNINSTIPAGTPNGSAYRVRVVSTTPAVTGTPNTTDFAIALAPQIVITRNPANASSLCGGSITLSIPNTYTGIVWSPGGQNTTSIEVTAAGDYSVTANGSEGCPATSEVISITAAQAPVANFTYTQPSGYLIEFTNTSENGTSYSWNFGAATTTSVNPTFTFPFDGEYPVTLIATNACGSDTIKITVIVKKFVGINELAAKANLQLHPVPAADLLNLELNYPVSEECVISVVNLTGQEIYREVCMLGGQLIRTIQSAHLAAGVYLLRVNSKSGSISRKFTKN